MSFKKSFTGSLTVKVNLMPLRMSLTYSPIAGDAVNPGDWITPV
jgi:hypothetical protein